MDGKTPYFAPRRGVPVPSNIPIIGQPDLVITLTVKPSGEVVFNTSKPTPMIAIIGLLAGVIQNGSAMVLESAKANGAKPTVLPGSIEEQV